MEWNAPYNTTTPNTTPIMSGLHFLLPACSKHNTHVSDRFPRRPFREVPVSHIQSLVNDDQVNDTKGRNQGSISTRNVFIFRKAEQKRDELKYRSAKFRTAFASCGAYSSSTDSHAQETSLRGVPTRNGVKKYYDHEQCRRKKKIQSINSWTPKRATITERNKI